MGIVPGMLIFGLFSGLCMPATTNAALSDVTEADSSLASGAQNAANQIGGSLGLAALVALAFRTATAGIADGLEPNAAVARGLQLSFWVSAAVLLVGGAVAATLMPSGRGVVVKNSPKPSGFESSPSAASSGSSPNA